MEKESIDNVTYIKDLIIQEYELEKKMKTKEYNREYYKKNREKLLEYQQIYNIENKEKKREYIIKYYNKISNNLTPQIMKKFNKESQKLLNKREAFSTRLRSNRRGWIDRGEKINSLIVTPGTVTVSFD